MKMDNPPPSIITIVTFLELGYTALVVCCVLCVACKDKEVCGSIDVKVALHTCLLLLIEPGGMTGQRSLR